MTLVNPYLYSPWMLDLDKLRAAREAAGLTQAQAAEASGLSGRQAWNNIERGRTDVTLATLDRIAKAVRKKAKDLLK